jgi:hypothetical protein
MAKRAKDNVTPLRQKQIVKKLDDVPAIAKYLDCIGAEARSPRTAVVKKEEGGYNRDDIARIKLDKDGVWQVWPDAYAPTEEELEAIEAQLDGFEWPTLVRMKRPTNLPQEISDGLREDLHREKPCVFEFRDMDDSVIMYQLRVELESGKKYIPWTYWGDKEWRQSEPDEPLPLWGLDQLRGDGVVVLHEGAKPARACREMVEGKSFALKDKLANHPWGESLSRAAHLGWIGGAFSPHRTDWTPLKKAGVKQVYIVADNDTPGVDAIPKIAYELRRWNIEVYCIRFDSRFPESFDLADDFFADANGDRLWTWREAAEGEEPTKRYIGPSFKELIEPATWAVEEVPEPAGTEKRGRGRPKGPAYRVRDVFRKQWVIARRMDPILFINRQNPTLQYKAENFNKVNRPFSGGAKNLAALLEAKPIWVDGPAYEPGRKPGELVLSGRRTINTWTPTLIEPVTGRHYDPQPWFDFMEHLFPVEWERQFVMRWCATLIARPDIRMTFGLLLISEHHGIGKTTLGTILATLVGEHNTEWPSEEQIVESQFNSWYANKRFVLVNEIYSGHSWKAYKKLKSAISDRDVTVNEKYQRPYTINNWAHMLLCSNSMEALKIEPHDPRIFQPQVTEQKKPGEYWKKLYAWLAGDGYGIIHHWAMQHVGYREKLTGRVRQGEVEPIGTEMHPPMTEMKRRAIRDATDEDQVLAEALAKQVVEMKGGKRIILIDRDVQEWVASKLDLRRSDTWRWQRSFANVRKGLRAAGLVLVLEYRYTGYAHEAYGNFNGSELGEGSNWQELVVKPSEAQKWTEHWAEM